MASCDYSDVMTTFCCWCC